MYTVSKRLEVSASHQLKLDYPSKCQNLHGHNWIIIVHCRSKELDHNSMVIDFTIIKEKIHGRGATLSIIIIRNILPSML